MKSRNRGSLGRPKPGSLIEPSLQTSANSQGIIESIWRIESPRLIAALRPILGSYDAAEEIVQAALVAGLANWPKSGKPHNPGAWLMKIAKNLAIDILRRRKRFETKSDELTSYLRSQHDDAAAEILLEWQGDHAGASFKPLDWGRLAGRIGLTYLEQRVFLAHWRRGVAPYRLAEELGMTPRAATQGYQMVLAKLRMSAARPCLLIGRARNSRTTVYRERGTWMAGGLDRSFSEIMNKEKFGLISERDPDEFPKYLRSFRRRFEMETMLAALTQSLAVEKAKLARISKGIRQAWDLERLQPALNCQAAIVANLESKIDYRRYAAQVAELERCGSGNVLMMKLMKMGSAVPPPPEWLRACPDAREFYQILAVEWCSAWGSLNGRMSEEIAFAALAVTNLVDRIAWKEPAGVITEFTGYVMENFSDLHLAHESADRLMREVYRHAAAAAA